MEYTTNTEVFQGGMRTILGLDLGTSSVGWALFEADDDLLPTALIDVGVRHFEEVVEPKTKALKNLKRRTMRGMRKNLRRRRQRRDNLLNALIAGKLLPEGATFAESEPTPHTPYLLRARAVEGPLELQELARALFHLGQRRGFKSNRGAALASLAREPEVLPLIERDDRQSASEAKKADETRQVLDAIESIRNALQGRTLGQYLCEEVLAGRRVRGRHADRAMIEDEFERIWQTQSPHYPNVLTGELKARIHHAIFFQRPLKVQKFLKAPCSLEPKKVRAERGQLIAQEFRYWQDLANLLLTDTSTGERRNLTQEEKHKLADHLSQQGTMSWSAVKTALGFRRGASVEFNLERAKGGELKGNATATRLARLIPDLWNSLDDDARENLVEILLTIPDRGKLYAALRRKYNLDVETAYQLAILELEDGTASLSSKAMRKILPHMKAGLSRSDAQVKAGYEPWNEARPVAALLPMVPDRKAIPNPRVRKALGQLRKVVNALIREYGKPTVVRLEMARDLSLTKKEKEGKEKANKQLAIENSQADLALREIGIQNPTRADRFWFRLHKQCGGVCPYTGRTIELTKASMGEFQIEHIMPYRRSLDDSFNNLTLCEAEANRKKGNRTPYEAFGSTPQWEDMVNRVSQWRGFGTGHKKRLFLQKEWKESDDFLRRQLNETRWICRAAADFLKPICDDVEVTKGQATAMLREHWNLFVTLLPEDADAEKAEKNRDDLRHHAIDAVAVAFTTRSLFQKITAHRKRAVSGGLEEDWKVPPLSDETVPAAPKWLYHALRQRLQTVVISHEPTRGISDALHQETALGLIDPTKGLYHFRKPLASMSKGEFERIKDPKLRELALEALRAAGEDPKKLADGILVNGRFVRRARITLVKPKSPMLETPRGFFELGNNHHVAIFEHVGTGKRKGVFVSTLEAAERARRRKEPIVDTRPPGPEWKFITWLCANDCVVLDAEPERVFRVESLWSTTEQLQLRDATYAGSEKAHRRLPNPNSLRGKKLAVSPIGKVREVPEGVV